MMNRPLVSRRVLVKTLTLGMAAASLRSAQTHGAEPQKLDVKDPAAVALGYVENAAQVDVKKYPAFVKGSNCENCLQLQGTAGSDYRPCALFPGKLVAVAGWCSSWTAEM
jgi:High potential iron-sulfur protein